MWCYIKLHNIIKELGYDAINYGILSLNDNGLSLSLLQNREAVMIYKNKEGRTIELWYNKTYKNLPTTSQRPDAVLCLKTKSTDERVYIFDAKYRVSVNKGIVGPNEEDINVMHRYRDSIVSELSNKYHFKYDTFGAYVMFPYSDEKQFMNHKFYKSIEKVNIGAFPMLPGCYNLMKKHIQKIITESDIEAKERILVYDEYDDYAKFKLKNVMVVNIKDDKHMQIYKYNKFFHIPRKFLKNIELGVEYVAFYEPKGKSNIGGIRYYGKIKEVKRYKRSECLEVPKNNDEEYLRFELEDVIQLNRCIEPVEYGIRLIAYTTLYLLKNAHNVHELHFKNAREIDIYKWMRNYSINNNVKIIRHSNYYEIEKNRIEILENGKLRINGVVIDEQYPKL
ncbi:nuclease domain-containing protein [Clostridium sp. ZC22-4]|uniref:Nuclease domain-containing protein n=1 Tax=Clostridium brassicae TaxID=2999072 RepID=A0ABT4DE19_9CLOT|nr:nuclease domain-containing protein [Clostridium brassicae]